MVCTNHAFTQNDKKFFLLVSSRWETQSKYGLIYFRNKKLIPLIYYIITLNKLKDILSPLFA
jgi:hypothetical protein